MAPTALLRMILSQGDALDRMAGLDLAEPAGVLAGAPGSSWSAPAPASTRPNSAR